MFISIEGNIGSGKSTIIQLWKNGIQAIDGLELVILQEPVNLWTEMHGSHPSILESLNTDPNRWAMTFQHYAFATMLEQYRSAQSHDDKIVIFERSIFSSRNVFAEVLHDNGYMNDLEWKIYTQWFDMFSSEVAMDGFIYLHTSPNVCMERIELRDRLEEKSLTSCDYLMDLETKHDEWMAQEQNVIELNNNESFDADIDSIPWKNELIDFVRHIRGEVPRGNCLLM